MGSCVTFIFCLSLNVLILLESSVFCAIIIDSYKACQGAVINSFNKSTHFCFLVFMQSYELAIINILSLQ